MNIERRLRSPLLLALLLGLSSLMSANAAARADEPVASPDDAAVQAADSLAPGEYQWYPERSPTGQMVLVVSLPEQRMHVYRNGVRIGVTTVSSGKPGKDTPTGVFEILEKRRMHRSNLYNSAPMPFMQRLTWDGVALHAGHIPGRPASHGCVRLPEAFARLLFDETERGTLVVIADALSNSAAVLNPGDRAPVDTYSGAELVTTTAPVADQATTRVATANSP